MTQLTDNQVNLLRKILGSCFSSNDCDFIGSLIDLLLSGSSVFVPIINIDRRSTTTIGDIDSSVVVVSSSGKINAQSKTETS